MAFKILFNPISGTFNEENLKNTLNGFLAGETLEYSDIREVDYPEFIGGLGPDDKILIAGGDGTLNRFINDTDSLKFKTEVWYYAAGSGNDFWHDIGRSKGDAPVCIDEYLKDLPSVTVNGKSYKFINGVGFGIDGYCCEEGDRLKAAGKKVNYTSIAIKGLLFKFKPANAVVTVDGVEKRFKKAWIAPTMLGRFYGGGMMPTPKQDRTDAERKVSCCLFYGKGKIKTLMAFPKIFTGEHVKKKKMVQILSGKEVTVKFSKPCALQIDGETILGVTEYTVHFSAVSANKEVA